MSYYEDTGFMVVADERAFELSRECLHVLAVPTNDAPHVTIATIFHCDVLLSWNFAHLVNYQNRIKINGINLLNGYKEISIISPFELGD